MKIRIIAVAAALLLLLTLNVSAAGYEYTISPGTDFTSVQYGDDLSDISQKLNMTTDELNAYFNQNGLLYLAVSDDTKTQIRLSAFTDNFSSSVSDISYLDDKALGEFMSAISEEDENNCEVVVNNGRKYIVIKDTLKDSGGTYTVTQYITICDSKTFYLSCYNEGEDTSAEVKSAFKNFSVNEVETPSNSYTMPTVFVIIGIVVFSAIAVFMIIGIVKTVRKSQREKTQDKT